MVEADLKRRLLLEHAPMAVFAYAITLYLLAMVAVFAFNGTYAYHTRTNLGHPIDIAFSDAPLLFIALSIGQLALAFLAGGLGTESAYHVVRILKPSLGWPIRPRFKPFRLGFILVRVAVVFAIAWMVSFWFTSRGT